MLWIYPISSLEPFSGRKLAELRGQVDQIHRVNCPLLLRERSKCRWCEQGLLTMAIFAPDSTIVYYDLGSVVGPKP